jgi:hypothetical protein
MTLAAPNSASRPSVVHERENRTAWWRMEGCIRCSAEMSISFNVQQVTCEEGD